MVVAAVLALSSLPFLFNERTGVLGEGIYTNDHAAQLFWADWLADGLIRYEDLLADWHAQINDKLGGDLAAIQRCGRYMEEAFEALGVARSSVTYVYANDGRTLLTQFYEEHPDLFRAPEYRGFTLASLDAFEPEGLTSNEIYPNGISTSLPFDVQLELVHSIPGLENAEFARLGGLHRNTFLNSSRVLDEGAGGVLLLRPLVTWARRAEIRRARSRPSSRTALLRTAALPRARRAPPAYRSSRGKRCTG